MKIKCQWPVGKGECGRPALPNTDVCTRHKPDLIRVLVKKWEGRIPKR